MDTWRLSTSEHVPHIMKLVSIIIFILIETGAINLALGRETGHGGQLYQDYSSDRAMDGNSQAMPGHHTCFRASQWSRDSLVSWNVQLGSIYRIARIVITARNSSSSAGCYLLCYFVYF